MDQSQQAYCFAWQGIGIAMTYMSCRWTVIEHLEIRSIDPEGAQLPITNTRYCSHSCNPAPLKPMAAIW